MHGQNHIKSRNILKTNVTPQTQEVATSVYSYLLMQVPPYHFETSLR